MKKALLLLFAVMFASTAFADVNIGGPNIMKAGAPTAADPQIIVLMYQYLQANDDRSLRGLLQTGSIVVTEEAQTVNVLAIDGGIVEVENHGAILFTDKSHVEMIH